MGFVGTWAVRDGQTPASLARMATYGALPEPGVVEPDHCRLVVTSGNTVGLTVGACVISAGTSGSARWQSYVTAVDSTDNEAVAQIDMPVGSRRDRYAVIAVPDPEWAGVPKAQNPLTATYGELLILTGSQLRDLPKPYYQVATLDIPAGATSLQQSMITDSRRMSSEKQIYRPFAYNLVRQDGVQDLRSSDVPVLWPERALQDRVGWEVYIPHWATKAVIKAAWLSVRVGAWDKHGVIYTRIGRPAGYGQGNVESQHQLWDLTGANPGREDWRVADSVNIPAAMRDTTQPLRMLGYRLESFSGGVPSLQSNSSIEFDVTFQGRTV